jgi:ribonuclease HI
MSTFLLPKELCREINSTMQKFWWGHKENDRKIHWMSWKKMGKTKTNGGMGFRDIHSFNKALLAKQGWRLMQESSSLAGRILKAKYYKSCSFLEAKKESRSLFAWQSILAARSLLVEGLCWRVGDGRTIKIWGDKWIPRQSTFAIQSPCRLLAPEAKVEELINRETGEWNVPLIHDIFHGEEADLICNIPLSKLGPPDRLIWRPTTTGCFTVCSAYFMEKERQEKLKGEGSSKTDTQLLWKYLWRLEIPNAAKVFCWRACNNILPTKDNLRRRGIINEDKCIFCARETETASHVLWECPSARDVWCVSGRRIQKTQSQDASFLDIRELFMNRCTKEDLNFVVVAAKKIWACRNAVVHGGVFTPPNRIVCEVEEQLRKLKELATVQEGRQRGNGERTEQRWAKPPFGRYKINWDVAIDTKLHRMGFGVIIRDHRGAVCAAKCKRFNRDYEPVIGEAMAAMEAVEFSKDRGLLDIMLEGDSLQVVQAIKEPTPSWKKYGHFIDAIRDILGSHRSWIVAHVKRDANKAAHGLAQEGLHQTDERIWINELPECISAIVSSELDALIV